MEDESLQNIILKKKVNQLSDDNQKLQTTVNELFQTVEGLKVTVDNLQKSLNEKVDGENILDAIVYAIEEVKEFD
ncbi:hypothetical protein JC777_00340 (plasmid) [Bacillus cytotoxicus]|uniref:Uncharacterized protein n=1 Tax=Bacillus cytotoxicus TaxID=580165 RepID=A0AAX2CPS9_9BACI|nr:hypothetical protein [Bacillus cytotoxicus]MDH2882488.1 hypothetical protein [Bacillus cytotoxicus]QTR81168.1 hypothetical protein JC777_00340 [Bacillus cytotoxicus]QTR87942.1 hypothetical protein JC774_05325 [Bacillus cytotoxicus]SCM08508.1 Uncharacterized protein BCB44BAC_04623 [Bacillus cytotoxicus]HDR4573350.1 hypothetical protein [Bacillus cytotoxicus]